MSMRDIAIVITIGVALLILVTMLFAWRRRLRRDAGYTAPLGVPQHAEVLSRHEVLYVATTRHDEPLERLAIRPLAYRARGEIAVTDRGAALSLDGAPNVFFATEKLAGVDRATVTIDRVVERGGLVRLAWRVDAETIVDSYLRCASGAPDTLISELQRLMAAHNTGATS